jgi:hypothetical protein
MCQPKWRNVWLSAKCHAMERESGAASICSCIAAPLKAIHVAYSILGVAAVGVKKCNNQCNQ